jgi:hypothetical protein
MRTIGWCMLFLGMVAGAAAQSMSTTQTTLSVATDNAGPRTRTTLTAHVSGDSPAGVVNFRSGNTDLGSAVLNAEGDASLQTDVLPAGNHQVVAVYHADQSNEQTSTSQPELVHANASTVAGFTVSASPTTLSTAVGGFVNVNVTVTPVNGFNAYVALSCSGLPVNTTCTFTPVNVPAICSTTCASANSVMQIQTQAPSPKVAAFAFPALFGLIGLGAYKRRAWRNLLLGVFALVAALGMSACSQRYNYLNHGPPANFGTPTGTYTVTIQAQSSTGSETTVPPSLPQLTLTVN